LVAGGWKGYSENQMKPLLSESEDNALRALGRASVQIVHDLKNQLNGLKLYATFLRKRIEKGERPADELETVNKLIAGLDRAAVDLSMIVEFGQPLSLKKQAGIDLEKMMREIAGYLNGQPPITGALTSSIVIDATPVRLVGEFDSVLLGAALKSISLCAMKMLNNKVCEGPLRVQLKSEALGTRRNGVIEWQVFDSSARDPFHSFAGSNEIRLSLAAKVIEAHGGSAKRQDHTLCVRLPLEP
jgi:light-regulated signal transduction histidine kinase (bacteriophytochrome)